MVIVNQILQNENRKPTIDDFGISKFYHVFVLLYIE